MTRGKRTHKILLADAHLLFRRGLRTLLSAESDLDVVGEASSVAEALGTAQQTMPNVLVMDLAMLQEQGEQGPLAVRQIDSSIGVLFLTQEDSPEQLELAIAAGARGYMLKNSPARQLLAGIRQIATSDDQNPRSLSRLVPDLQAL
ncbi:MAG TPA: response regulator transcription factor, partial [Bryobacteraceae bacterium]|nr:response regulator transcription factor [Bryobacteraceae bacterium]